MLARQRGHVTCFSASLQAASLKRPLAPVQRRRAGGFFRLFAGGLIEARIEDAIVRAVRAGFSASLQAASLKRGGGARTRRAPKKFFRLFAGGLIEA